MRRDIGAWHVKYMTVLPDRRDFRLTAARRLLLGLLEVRSHQRPLLPRGWYAGTVVM